MVQPTLRLGNKDTESNRICRLATVVEHELRDVLDEADHQLDVGEDDDHHKRAQPREPVHVHANDAQHYDEEDQGEDENGCPADSLSVSLVNERLEDCERSDEHGVRREEEIIHHHLQ